MVINRTYYAERKSVPEVQAEERALREAHRARGGGDVVLTLSAQGGGALHVGVPTPEDPSPTARRLEERLREVKSSADWGAVVDALTDARAEDAVATWEWARLLAAAGDLALAQGWIGRDDWAGAHRLVQGALTRGRRG